MRCRNCRNKPQTPFVLSLAKDRFAFGNGERKVLPFDKLRANGIRKPMTDLFSKFDEIIALRANLLASGQEDPFSLVMEKVLSPTRAICNGRDTILLGTYKWAFEPPFSEAH